MNVIGCLNVADICNARGIHLTFYSTGCIFYYDEAHAMGSGIGFTEEDKPNFIGSFYAETKVILGVRPIRSWSSFANVALLVI